MNIIERTLGVLASIDPGFSVLKKDLLTTQAIDYASKIFAGCESLEELIKRRQELELNYLNSNCNDPLASIAIPLLKQIEINVATGRKSLQKPTSI